MLDPYEVLGVPRTATEDEIKKAYRELAKEHHPDRNPGEAAHEERYKLIVDAYEVLGNPERRAEYDATGAVSKKAAGDIADLMTILGPCYEDVVNGLKTKLLNPVNVDLIDRMRRYLDGSLVRAKHQMENFAKARDLAKDIASRFEADGVDNLMASYIGGHVANLDAQLAEAERCQQRHAKAIEYLGKCKYRSNAKEVWDWGQRMITATLYTEGGNGE